VERGELPPSGRWNRKQVGFSAVAVERYLSELLGEAG
jgi:hypothetical protein